MLLGDLAAVSFYQCKDRKRSNLLLLGLFVVVRGGIQRQTIDCESIVSDVNNRSGCCAREEKGYGQNLTR